jgi:hypothetical protein
MLDNLERHITKLVDILMHTSKLTYASVGVGLLVAFLYFRIFFYDGSQFEQDAENAAKAELMSRTLFWPLRWIYDRDEFRWSELKILIWIALSVGSGILAYHQLPEWFPVLFR